MSRETDTGGLPQGALPIEPLGDVAWQRIERNLFARLAASAAPAPAATAVPRAAGRRHVAAGVLVLAIAAAAFVVWQWSGGSGRGHRAGRDARAPSRIATADAPSSVVFGDVALEVAPRSAVLVDDRDDGVLVVLDRGAVTFRVAPRRSRPPLVVQAGDLRVEVVGTVFAVSREGDSARVEVFEGSVWLVHRGQRTRLDAGASWPSSPEPSPGPGDEILEPVPAPAPESPAAEGRRPQRKPHSDRVTEVAPPAAPRLSDKARYEQAAKLERSSPAAALDIYRQLAAGGGPWAANALYASAQLELDLGHRDRAHALLRTYLERFPRGANVEDARDLLKR